VKQLSLPVFVFTVALAAVPSAGFAQTASSSQGNVPAAAQQAGDAAENVARRFGLGVSGGVGLDPELIDFGAHARFGPIFTPSLAFRPGIEFGLGEVTTMFGINLDVVYTLGAASGGTWSPYVGAGPNFALSHRGFEADEGDADHVDTNDDTDTGDSPSRFDFSDTDFSGGFNFIAGARRGNGLFIEMKATAYGVSNIRLLAGFNF
jgi:hypothetical protein